MKHLSDYIEEAQTVAFRNAGAFFAFSQRQFNEQKKTDTKYVNLGGGLICEKGREDQLCETLDKIAEDGIKQDVKENGKDAIIRRELFNHECQITMSPEECTRALKDYPITEAEIFKAFPAFMQLCCDNDYF